MEEHIEQSPSADWTDMDLLTRGEAVGKLAAEIHSEQVRLAALPDTPANAEVRGRLKHRINALTQIKHNVAQ